MVILVGKCRNFFVILFDRQISCNIMYSSGYALVKEFHYGWSFALQVAALSSLVYVPTMLTQENICVDVTRVTNNSTICVYRSIKVSF